MGVPGEASLSLESGDLLMLTLNVVKKRDSHVAVDCETLAGPGKHHSRDGQAAKPVARFSLRS